MDQFSCLICDRLFCQKIPTGDLFNLAKTYSVLDIEHLNDEDMYVTLFNSIFGLAIRTSKNRFSKMYPNILPNKPFEWYFARISRFSLFLYWALFSNPPDIYTDFPELKQLARKMNPLDSIKKLQLIKTICFGDFDNFYHLIEDILHSVTNVFIYLLPHIAHLLETCTHLLTRYQLFGLMKLLIIGLPKVNSDSTLSIENMVRSVISTFKCKENLDIPEELSKMRSFYNQLPENLLFKHLTDTNYRGTTSLSDFFHQFCNCKTHENMFTLSVSHFNQEKHHFLYLINSSQPVTSCGVILSNAGGPMTVAFSYGKGQLAFYPLPFFDMYEIYNQSIQPVDSKIEVRNSYSKTKGNAFNRIDRTLDSIANQLWKLHYQVSPSKKHFKKQLTWKCIPSETEYLKGFTRFIQIYQKQKGKNVPLGQGFQKLNFNTSISNCKASEKVIDEALDQLRDCIPDYLFLKEKTLEGCDANGYHVIQMLDIKLKECLFQTYRWTIEINQNPPNGFQQITTIGKDENDGSRYLLRTLIFL